MPKNSVWTQDQICSNAVREKGRKKMSCKQTVSILLKSCYIGTHAEIAVSGQWCLFNNYVQRKVGKLSSKRV